VIRILIDVSLSPAWTGTFSAAGLESVHWSSVGDPRATARTIMGWAVDNGYIVFTHDLDFGALIAVTRARGPSVIQVRAQDVLPESLGAVVVSAISRFRAELEKGALISLDPARARVRMLPIVESGADEVPDA